MRVPFRMILTVALCNTEELTILTYIVEPQIHTLHKTIHYTTCLLYTSIQCSKYAQHVFSFVYKHPSFTAIHDNR